MKAPKEMTDDNTVEGWDIEEFIQEKRKNSKYIEIFFDKEIMMYLNKLIYDEED